MNAATLDVTNNLLVVTNAYQNLQGISLFAQLSDGVLIVILVALFAGAIGEQESAQLVKHQQLASGASKLAYWISIFIFDFVVIFILPLFFTILLVIFTPGQFTGDSFGVVFISAIVFCIASIFRFYIISFIISDVRMAQTIYFYGSVFTMFV
eukprot:gene42898-53225_t